MSPISRPFSCLLTALSLTAFPLLTGLAGAAHAHAYVGGSLGLVRSAHSCTAGTPCRKVDSTFRLVLGRAFKNGVALEAGYADLGQFRTQLGGQETDVQAKEVFVGLAYRLPLGTSQWWHAGMRAGLGKRSARSQTDTGTATASSLSPYIGVAGGYLISQELRLELGLEVSRLAMKATTGRESRPPLMQTTASLLYAF